MSTEQVPLNTPASVVSYLSWLKSTTGIELELKKKSSSKLMRAVGWLFKTLRVNDKFLTAYYTTIGHTVYIPDQTWDLLSNPTVPLSEELKSTLLQVVVHESWHAMDEKRLTGPVFKFLYLFPQSLAGLSLLLGVLSSLATGSLTPFLWSLLGLVFLAPLPAPWRYQFELRAYMTGLVFAKVNGVTETQEYKSWIIKQLSTSLYYYTWPFPKGIQRTLDGFVTNPSESGGYHGLESWLISYKEESNTKKKQGY